MRGIKIRNKTGLSNMAVLCRAALYLNEQVEEALEGGYQIRKSWNGKKLTITEKRDGTAQAWVFGAIIKKRT